MGRLAGRVGVVTGAGPGIGRAIGLAFAREGCAVALVDVDARAAHETACEIDAAGGRVLVVEGDASLEPTWQEIDERVRTAFGAADVLVNSVSSGMARGTVVEMSVEEWDRAAALNLRSAFLGCRTIIPGMLERGGGSIVNISSACAVAAVPRLVAYAAGKAGLEGLTRNVALDFGLRGIRSNAIAPGSVLTTAAAEALPPDEAATMRDNYLVGRWGVPDDIAHAAVYLASDESSFVTGVVLPVDGGLTIQSPEATVRQSFRAQWRGDRVRIVP